MPTEIIRPIGAGTYTGCNPTSGANWSCVDEIAKNESDNVYITNSETLHCDTYVLQNPSNIGSSDIINSVTLNGYFARTFGSGYVEWGFWYKCGAIEVEKVPASITSSTYLLKTKAYLTNSGSSWTLTDLNNLEAGPQLYGNFATTISCCQFWVEIDYTHVSKCNRAQIIGLC